MVFVIAQLVGPGWFVLYMATANASAARAGEVALAKLRGFPPGAVLAFGLLEVLLLLAAAVLPGLLAGRAGIGLVAATQLLPGTPVEVPPGALAGCRGVRRPALVAAFLAGSACCGAACPSWPAGRSAGRPGRRQVLGEAVAFVAAGAGLTLLLLGGALGHEQQGDFQATALLVPGLVTLMAAAGRGAPVRHRLPGRLPPDPGVPAPGGLPGRPPGGASPRSGSAWSPPPLPSVWPPSRSPAGRCSAATATTGRWPRWARHGC